MQSLWKWKIKKKKKTFIYLKLLNGSSFRLELNLWINHAACMALHYRFYITAHGFTLIMIAFPIDMVNWIQSQVHILYISLGV